MDSEDSDMVPITAKVSPETKERVKTYVEDHGYSGRSEFVRQLILTHFDEEEPDTGSGGGLRGTLDRLVRAGDHFAGAAFAVVFAVALADALAFLLPLAPLAPALMLAGYSLAGAFVVLATVTYVAAGTAARLAGIGWLWTQRAAVGREWLDRVRGDGA